VEWWGGVEWLCWLFELDGRVRKVVAALSCVEGCAGVVMESLCGGTIAPFCTQPVFTCAFAVHKSMMIATKDLAVRSALAVI